MASISKTLTAAAILKLVEQGKLKLEDRPFHILSFIPPPRGVFPDPRLKQITVRQLLNHSGGWDPQKSGDPVNWVTQVQYQRGDKQPISAEHLISFTMSVRLDFDPGTDQKYSNFGYIVLGEVIRKVSGQSYERFVQTEVLKPSGITRATLHPLNGKYFPNEARRYLAGNDNELPPWKQKYSDAAGGWVISAIDLIRFMTAIDGSRGTPLLKPATFEQMIAAPQPPLKPRANGTYYGLGWDGVIQNDKGYALFKDGMWFGMRSFMKRQPNGVCWALVLNASMQPDTDDFRVAGDAIKHVREKLEAIEKHPDVDLFPDFK